MTTPTPAQEMKPGLIRTLTPFLIGLLGSWATRQGLDLNDDLLSAALVAVYGYGYYVVARLGEVYGSSNWSYILGFTKQKPGYAVPPATVKVNDPDAPDRDARGRFKRDDGAVDVLYLVGLGLLLIGAILLVIGAVATPATLHVPGLVLAVVGLVLLLVKQGAIR